MRFITAAFISLFLLLTSCTSEEISSVQSADSEEYQSMNIGEWSVHYNPFDETLGRVELLLETTSYAEGRNETDSLNYDDPLPDSLRFNREWRIGASSVLLFSVVIADRADEQLIALARSVCETALIVRPDGLRSVFLADRSGSTIDMERASSAVEPPPEVSHHLLVYYQQDSTSNSLEIIDSLVVDFRESNADSLEFTYIHRDTSSVISSTAGIFRRGGSSDQYICFSDSTGMYTGVFRNRFQINIPYLDTSGRVSVHSRLTSAYLSGDAYYPISNTPESYHVQIFLPGSLTAWTPLARNESTGVWYSNPGGIVGGLPIAIGSYSENSLFPRYKILTLEGSPISSLDSTSIEMIASTLRSTLDFPSAEFCFVEIINPDGPVVISSFGGMLFSRGSLECLADVSNWDDNLAAGVLPAGSDILIGAAKGMLVQSLQLDPILRDMLASWVPLRYFSSFSEDEAATVAMRKAYLKYYLVNTEVLGGDGSTPVVAEYALGDPLQNNSPLRSFVSSGKGVIVLEYLNSLRLLNRLPYLLQDFKHASSGNFWLKISSSLRVYRNTEQYDLLRALLYQPGIPQIRVSWEEEDGKILIGMTEIQPGQPFNLDFGECLLTLSDTTITRVLMPSIEPGIIQCTAGPPGSGSVQAIDLNHLAEIPADLMYSRILTGGRE